MKLEVDNPINVGGKMQNNNAEEILANRKAILKEPFTNSGLQLRSCVTFHHFPSLPGIIIPKTHRKHGHLLNLNGLKRDFALNMPRVP